MEKKILDLCLKVNGLSSYYPQFNQVDKSILEPTPDMIGKYGWNNEILAFVDEKGNYYVTPYCAEVSEYLSKNGYTNGYIYVPFSNGEEPSDRIVAQEWKKICVEAKELHSRKEKERQQDQINKYLVNKNIKELTQEVYDKSIEIPSKGFGVSFYDSEYNVVRPIPNFDLGVAIGTYYHNNGKLIFVDKKGKTYLSPYYHDLSLRLKNAGYKERKMFVPLSNGEDILDENINAKWQKLCMEANEVNKIRINLERKAELQNLAIVKGIKPLPLDIYKLSFYIPPKGVDTLWFGEKKDITYPINEWSLKVYLGSYFHNNGKIVFVDDKGDTFVSPFASELTPALIECGYRERSMYVPFSNGDVPEDKVLLLKWKQLCALSRRAYKTRSEERKVRRRNELANKKGISKLPGVVYNMSMEIPKEGFETIFFDTEKDITRPIYEWELDYALGTYCSNNGRLVFVDNYGNTYVTPYVSEVKNYLVDAGYSKASLFVPLSNGEKIINDDLNKKWEALCSRIKD